MILVDSSVWIDYFIGNDSAEADFLDRTLGNRAVAIGDLILTEVLQGFRHEKDYKVAKSLLEELTVFELLGKRMAIKVGWPGASQPPAPTDPGVTVSRHRALLASCQGERTHCQWTKRRGSLSSTPIHHRLNRL